MQKINHLLKNFDLVYKIFSSVFLLFTASVRSRQPGPNIVSGVFKMGFKTIFRMITVQGWANTPRKNIRPRNLFVERTVFVERNLVWPRELYGVRNICAKKIGPTKIYCPASNREKLGTYTLVLNTSKLSRLKLLSYHPFGFGETKFSPPKQKSFFLNESLFFTFVWSSCSRSQSQTWLLLTIDRL